jgi:hypothetical protein
MPATMERSKSEVHSSGCNCSSCQNNSGNKTVIDEILQEVYQPQLKTNTGCSCHACKHAKQQNELELIQQQMQRIGSGLSFEEELELGKALVKIKELAKKGVRKASHPAFGLLLKAASLFNPHQQLPAHPEQTLDYARYAEEENRRRREAGMQQAIQNKRAKVAGKPQ